MIALLLGSHLFFTFKTGFIQRKLPMAIKLSLSSDPEGKGDISHFGALATALAATIGTGSIVGVATAILAGGPGAVFWMWITGVFGIATKYAEVYAAVKYRVRDHNGAMLGGAMYIWERAFRRNAEGKRDPSPGGHTPCGRSSALWRSPRSRPSRPLELVRPCRRRPCPASSPRTWTCPRGSSA